MTQVNNIEYVKKRAELSGKLSRIDIYNGFINPGNKGQALIKVQEIRPSTERDNLDSVFSFFEKTTHGDFTAVFFPSREIIYFSNKGSEVMNGTNNQYSGIPTEEMIQAQVAKILENERLKDKLARLEAEAEENSMWGKRMGVAMEMLVSNLLGLNKNVEMEAEPALNGTETIDTSNMNETERALVILVEKFGEEWLKKFAAKIQAEPHIVPQIKNFFS